MPRFALPSRNDQKWPKKQMDLRSRNRWFQLPARLARVKDGWLAGYDAGEFGAELWWFSTDGSKKYKVSDDQINQFLVDGENVYAAEGLSHLSTSAGSITMLSRKNERWVATTLAKFDLFEPQAVVKMKNSDLLVIGDMGVSLISPKGVIKKHPVIKAPPVLWRITSGARENDKLYLGSIYFVMEIHLKTNKQRYLLPTKEHWAKLQQSFDPDAFP